MLTLALIKENPEEVIARLAVKHFDGRGPITRVIELDKERREAQTTRDNQAARLNKLAAEIGALMKQGKKDEAEKVKAEVAELKENNRAIDERVKKAEAEITEILLSVPNVPSPMVPEGNGAADNVVEKTGGPMPDLPEDAL